MWLRSLVALMRATSRLRPAPHRPRRAPAVRCRPHLEVLEDRRLLSTFTVVSPGDTGTGTGTSGDLRYCIARADATGKTDTITFSSVFAKPQTILLNPALGPLMLDDSHPLTIKGPAGGTATVSGGDQVGVFDVSSGTVVTISNLAITHGNSIFGGGISNNSGTLTLTNCTISNNAARGGGGIATGGTLTLTNCTLSNNSASDGGGIYNEGMVTLTNCTLSNNAANSVNGGGIENYGTVKLTNCTLINNAAKSGNGGGIYNDGTATLTNCTLSNNSANVYGGGGIDNYVGSTATLTNCTLSNNAASYTGGGISNLGTLTLTDCTLSNNSASTGGGIFNGGTATLTNCTLSNNAAIYYGGGIFTNGTLNLTNTLVAENSASTGPDIDGAVSTADHDLIGDGSGSTGISNGVGGNLVGGNGNPVLDPWLGPLQNNGGPTQTEALLPGSPAIGQADNAFAPLRDQRGVVRLRVVGRRVLGGPTDIGAYET